MLRFGLFLYFFTGLYQVSLADSVLTITSEQEQYFIKPYLQIYHDTVTLKRYDAIPANIPKAQFQPINKVKGYGKGRFWLKLEVVTQQGAVWAG